MFYGKQKTAMQWALSGNLNENLARGKIMSSGHVTCATREAWEYVNSGVRNIIIADRVENLFHDYEAVTSHVR